jgi:hypothetical protein
MPGPWNFDEIGNVIATYSGGPSLAGVPAGGRPEGAEFERAVATAWITFVQQMKSVATIYAVGSRRQGQPSAIKIQSHAGPWAIYLNRSDELAALADETTEENVPPEWLRLKFDVSELLLAHLGPGPYPFAPRDQRDSRNYHGENYPALFAGRTTNFDFGGALAERGQLKEKLLFEYKYAKSTGGSGIDGNAHERLSFQILQYVEIALQYPACSLNVIAAQAFSEYKNKYHPSFNQQATRLNSVFQQVHFRYAACRSEYVALFTAFAQYLTDGSLPPVDYRDAR